MLFEDLANPPTPGVYFITHFDIVNPSSRKWTAAEWNMRQGRAVMTTVGLLEKRSEPPRTHLQKPESKGNE